jgi:hypothetical protein
MRAGVDRSHGNRRFEADATALRFCMSSADCLRMPEVQEQGLVIDADEEAYLRGEFRRFARPYIAGMLALVTALWFLALNDGPAASPETNGSASSAGEDSQALQTELAKLQAELARVRDLARDAKQVASARPTPTHAPPAARDGHPDLHSSPEWKALVARLNAMTTRVKTLETRPTERVERVVTRDASPAPADGTAQSLLERMYNIETRQEKEEQEFRQTQKSMLDRIYAIETQRDAAVAERRSLDQSVLSRMQNIEDRFYAMEQREAESVPASPKP